MRTLAVIRPEPGCRATVAAARGLGLAATGHPLFKVSPRKWDFPDEVCDALLIGSANALRYAGVKLDLLRDRPVLAVGQTTATVARSANFTVAAVSEGGLQSLLDALDPEYHCLLRLTGEERVELTPPPGVELVERVVYASEPLPMPEVFAAELRDGGVVLLHSAAAAHHFAAECERLAIPRSALSLACIGPRVAEVAGNGWATVQSATAPNDAALLALARGMCQ